VSKKERKEERTRGQGDISEPYRHRDPSCSHEFAPPWAQHCLKLQYLSRFDLSWWHMSAFR